MDLYELIARLGVALGIGLLIGLERGWHRRRARPGSRAAGIRTFAISALLGGLSAALAQALPKQDLGETPNLAGGIVLGVAFAAYSIVITLFSREENRAAGSFSATTAIAGMLTFALGAYALLGDIRIAAGVAVAVTALLASREELHDWVEKITWPELRSQAAAGEGSPRLLAAGVAIASAVMFLRVAGIVAALKPELLVLVAPALLAAALTAVSLAVAWMVLRQTGGQYRRVQFRNPFDFLSVVGFAVSSALSSCLVARRGKHSARPGRWQARSSSGLATSMRSPSR